VVDSSQYDVTKKSRDLHVRVNELIANVIPHGVMYCDSRH